MLVGSIALTGCGDSIPGFSSERGPRPTPSSTTALPDGRVHRNPDMRRVWDAHTSSSWKRPMEAPSGSAALETPSLEGPRPPARTDRRGPPRPASGRTFRSSAAHPAGRGFPREPHADLRLPARAPLRDRDGDRAAVARTRACSTSDPDGHEHAPRRARGDPRDSAPTVGASARADPDPGADGLCVRGAGAGVSRGGLQRASVEADRQPLLAALARHGRSSLAVAATWRTSQTTTSTSASPISRRSTRRSRRTTSSRSGCADTT